MVVSSKCKLRRGQVLIIIDIYINLLPFKFLLKRIPQHSFKFLMKLIKLL